MSSLDACTLDSSFITDHSFAVANQRRPQAASKRRRTQSQRLASSLIRKQHKSAKQQVLFRGDCFTHSTFLDPYPIVLAGNQDGITVIRINDDDYAAQQRDKNDDADGSLRRNTIYERRRESTSDSDQAICGTVLARGLDSRRDANSAIQATSPTYARREIQRIQSVRRGQAFAVGTSDGQFRVFSMEAGAEVWASQQKDWRRGEVVMKHDGSTPSPDRSNMHSFFGGQRDASVWQASFPVRRYDRRASFCLQDQINSPTSERLSLLYELTQWPAWTHPGGLLSKSDVDHRLWDFYDNGSSLVAAHVGGNQDYFGIRLQDDRCSGSHVIVDANAKHGATQGIASVCFISENMLATRICVYGRARDASTVKLWDLRYMQTALPSIIILPSFPRDSVLSQTAVLSHDLPDSDFDHDIQALPNGNLLCWTRDKCSGKLQGWSILDPTNCRTRCFMPPFQDSHKVTPCYTNRPSHMMAALTRFDTGLALGDGTKIVAFDIESFLERQASSGPVTGKKRNREQKDGAASLISTIPLACKDEYGFISELQDQLAMSADGSVFMCHSYADKLLFIVRGKSR